MPHYRRANTPGGTFFFTVVTHRRRLLFHKPEIREILRHVVNTVRNKHPFTSDAWVLLPDHMHCIWSLPGGCSNFSLRWSLIKSGFSKRMGHWFHTGEGMNASRVKHRESNIWQRRFWERQIRNENEYSACMDYIHYNPVRHGWVQRVADWPHSTFHRYVRMGVYPEDWGGVVEDEDRWELGE